MKNEESRAGGCLCGGVRYTARGPMREVVACHCEQCRKSSGHFVAATRVPAEALTLEKSESLRWFRSSDEAERGFCEVCGGNLFWRRVGGDAVSIHAGTLDAPTGLRLTRHIFVADKSDYYDIPEGEQTFAQAD